MLAPAAAARATAVMEEAALGAVEPPEVEVKMGRVVGGKAGRSRK